MNSAVFRTSRRGFLVHAGASLAATCWTDQLAAEGADPDLWHGDVAYPLMDQILEPPKS